MYKVFFESLLIDLSKQVFVELDLYLQVKIAEIETPLRFLIPYMHLWCEFEHPRSHRSRILANVKVFGTDVADAKHVNSSTFL